MISQGFILIHYTQLADGLRWTHGDLTRVHLYFTTKCTSNTNDTTSMSLSL